jgi:cold shock CspA family protein
MIAVMSDPDNRLTRIGVFYDGNYFAHVSNYYLYHHQRRARISMSGLHEFIRQQVAEREGSEPRHCQIVDAHYFRGRLRAQEAEDRGLLLRERSFDDVLMREGVVTHYLPLGPQGGEKGIDVWLALEAYELAIHKRFQVTVLLTCDGDFLPLVRKLNSLGTRVMVLGWAFKWVDQDNQERETRTAQVLMNEVTYPVLMHELIDDPARRSDPLINGLFLAPREPRPVAAPPSSEGDLLDGRVQSLKDGYGFITPASGGPNLFFFHAHLRDTDFNELQPGDRVRFRVGANERGPCAIDLERSP